MHQLPFAQLPDYHGHLFDETFGLRTDLQRVVKDHDGFVWLASNERIHRFDGRTVQDFFIGERINSLFCDRESNIWVNTTTNLYLYNKSRARFDEIILQEIGSDIGRVFQLTGKPVWLQTSTDFYEWNDSSNSFILLDWIELQIPTVSPYFFATYGSTIFALSNDSVYALDVDHHQRHALVCNHGAGLYPVSSHLLLITVRGNRSMWFDFSTGSITPIDVKKDIPGKRTEFLHIRDIIQLEPELHLVASHSGLFMLNSQTRKFRQLILYSRGKPLDPTPHYYDLFMDDEDKVWLAHGSGLITFSTSKEQIGLRRNHEIDPDKAWLNIARNFAEDEKGNLWISTSEGFGYWDLKSNAMTIHHPDFGRTDRLNQPSVRGLAYDGRYLIMGTSAAGVWLFDPGRNAYRRPSYGVDSKGKSLQEKFEVDFIRQITLLPDGNYFVCANHSYVLSGDDYGVSEFILPDSSSGRVTTCFIDRHKQIWMASNKELHCYDSTLHFIKSIRTGLNIEVLCEFHPDVFFGGTMNGLYTISTRKDPPEVFEANFLPGASRVMQILKDEKNKFWIGCDQGLFRYDSSSEKLELFDFADNVQGNIFLPNASYLNENGMLFLGGDNGINYFHPAKIEARNDSLHVRFVKLALGNEDTTYFQHPAAFSLKYFQNTMEIEYVAPYYGNTNRLEYKYRLQGYNNEWKHIGNNGFVRFTYLPPGKYEFNISASVNGYDWYESDQSIQFSILPPFWKRWWFVTLSALLLATAILIAVRLRIRFVRKQEAEKRESEVQLLTMNNDLASTRLTALRAQMNPHFIFNALNSVQRYILKGDVDQANKYLSKFSRLQREVLNNSKQDFISLEKEIQILELYLQLEQLRFDDKFEYTINVDEKIDTSEIKIPPMILQPFIENAIWHGLMPLAGPKKVDIQIELKEDELLYCSIRDNGIGRAASARLRNNHDGQALHESKGLSLVHERLHILEQLYQHPYRVDVIDRTDASGAVEGTEVNVVLHIGP